MQLLFFYPVMDEMMIFTVYEVSLHIRQLLESSLDPLYVTGEITNFTHHSSGHMYFNLKDPNATIRCTFFRGANLSLDFRPSDGMQVTCYGKITLFEKSGIYNLNITRMQVSGQGDLAKQFDLLKRKLDSEGLFAQEHKMRIPKFPEKVGIISSATGAAIQDIMNVFKRRFPVQVVLYPTLVQGLEAPKQLVEGIHYFNSRQSVDVIILTRGGGAQEDLLAFNDEELARAIFASKIPVISAVGHEIDFSISDFVADLRAPTPSAAAEIAVPDKQELSGYLSAIEKRIEMVFQKDLQSNKSALKSALILHKSLHPINLLNRKAQRIDLAEVSFRDVSKYVSQKRTSYERSVKDFNTSCSFAFRRNLTQFKSQLDNLDSVLKRLIEKRFEHYNDRLYYMGLRIDSDSPQKIMSKGYAVVRKNGIVVKSQSMLDTGDNVSVVLSDGIVDIVVVKTFENSL